MDGTAANAQGVCKTFIQMVPASDGRYENELVLNTEQPNCVQFNGCVYNARWCASDK